MAKNNPGDILTGDWNPLLGCEKTSIGCKNCWFLEGIFPWHQRLGLIPPGVSPHEVTVFEKRLTKAYLKAKSGIVGVVQHGDLFWEKVPESLIHRVLVLIDEVAAEKPQTRYILWSKRSARMARVLIERYPAGLPKHYAVSVSVETPTNAQARLPDLVRIPGLRVAMLEPFFEAVDLRPFIRDLDWVVVGSETGHAGVKPLDLNWVRQVRDVTKANGKLFFVKQLGSSHRVQERLLDGVEWSEFPEGFAK